MIKLVVAEYTQAKVNDMLAKQEAALRAEYAEEINGLEAEINNLEEIIENNPPLPEEALNITGDCSRRFANGGWDWYVETFGDKITTENITNAKDMFSQSNITEIPFDINIKDAYSFCSCFDGCNELTEIPAIRGNLKLDTSLDISYMLTGCLNVRNLENVFTPEMLEDLSAIKVTSVYSAPVCGNLFSYCNSLRQVPTWFYKLRISEESTAYPTATYSIYYNGFNNCHALDEILNLPVLRCYGSATAAQTKNMFNQSFNYCYRLKNFTFETDNETPYAVNWKSQSIDLSQNIGFSAGISSIINYNSGITADKEVTDDATYQALKNDPDWFAIIPDYSRYNHDSAVATINSLPDTSAYLATAGGTNTIKFRGAAGSKTDGGAINTLTAEEIAVATAKGWTVSFV